MIDNRLKQISEINKIYRKVLGRDADSSGISSYIGLLSDPNGANVLEKILYNSAEYRNKAIGSSTTDHNSFNSMTGDRVSYIDSKNTKYIDNSKYKNLLEKIIHHLILLENTNFDKNNLNNRINIIKQSLTHINSKNLNFTIFPHKEYLYNTSSFIDSLKQKNNFQYFICFIAILNIWKTIFGKTVATCGTDKILNKIVKVDTVSDLIWSMKEYIIEYFSIKIYGQILSSNKITHLESLLLQQKYTEFLDFIVSEKISIEKTEQNTIETNISDLTKQLGRKPKVLVTIAYLETQNSKFIDYMMYNLNMLQSANPLLDIDFALDNERVDREPNDYTPWSRVKRIRNLMINKYNIHDYDYLYIIDSDIVDYPHNFPSRAIGLNPLGITAPLALIQYSTTFYDWCGYQKLGATSIHSQYAKYILEKSCEIRNFRLKPPYIDDTARLAQIDCVGCTYIVPTSIFNKTYGNLQDELIKIFDIANVKNHKIKDNIVQYEDHPSFTDHYTICAAVRANGGKIIMDQGSPAYHADLPLYGENWH